MDFLTLYNTKTNMITGHLYEEEARLLFDCALQTPQGGTMVEIGCDLGRSTTILASVAHHLSTKLHVVDNFSYDYNSEEAFLGNMLKFGLSEDIILTVGDSVAVAKQATTPIDFLFIDADHAEPGIKADCKAWLPKVRSGGVAVFHDYDSPTFPAVKVRVDQATEGWAVLGSAPLIQAWRKP